MTAEDLDRAVAEGLGWARSIVHDLGGSYQVWRRGSEVRRTFGHRADDVQMEMLQKLGDLRGWEGAFPMILEELSDWNVDIRGAIARAFVAAVKGEGSR